MCGWQVGEGDIGVQSELMPQSVQHSGEEWHLVGVGPGGDGAFGQGFLFVGDQCGQVGALLDPQSLARGAPAERAVEGEVVGSQFLKTASAGLAGGVQAERFDDPVGFVSSRVLTRDPHFSSTQSQCHFDAVGHSGPRGLAGGNAIDDHFDGVSSASVDFRHIINPAGGPIDADSTEAIVLESPPEVVVVLSDSDLLRRQDQHPDTLGQIGDSGDDQVGCLSADGNVAVRADACTESSEQDAEVVVDFGHRADGGTGSGSGVLLFDGDGW